MEAYAPLSQGAEPAYCTSSCTATLYVCQSLWELGGALEFLQLIYYQACGSTVEPCMASDYTQAEPIAFDETACPGSLVVPDKRSHKGDGEIHGIEGTGRSEEHTSELQSLM